MSIVQPIYKIVDEIQELIVPPDLQYVASELVTNQFSNANQYAAAAIEAANEALIAFGQIDLTPGTNDAVVDIPEWG